MSKKNSIDDAINDSSTSFDTSMKRGYDRHAGTYDASRFDLNAEGELFTEMEAAVLKLWISGDRNEKVLDLPAGTGRLTIPLAKFCDSVVGADISDKMLERARIKAAEAQVDNIVFEVANGRELHYHDDTFDAVTSFKLFHLIPNDQKSAFLEEMLRVTKPGGVVILEFTSPFYGGLLAIIRYRFKFRAMRYKCLFPGQFKQLFPGITISRIHGVKMPKAAFWSRIFGRKAILYINSILGRIPLVRSLLFAIMVEIKKEGSQPPERS